MKMIGKKLIPVSVVLVCVCLLTPGTALSFSGSAGEDIPVGAPWGLAIDGDAAGTKLSGFLVIEYINWGDTGDGTDNADMARVLLRLSKGKDIKGDNEQGKGVKGHELMAFYDEVPGPLSPAATPGIVQDLITAKMAGAVLTAFFPGETGLGITLKTIDGYTSAYAPAFIPRDAVTPDYGGCSTVTVLTCDVDTNPLCDPLDPAWWTDIVSCDGDYEFCGNGIDDDGDLKLDTNIGHLRDPDCTEQSVFVFFDVELAVK